MRIKNEFFQIPVCHRFEADAGRLVVVNPRKWSFYRSADVKTRFMPRLSKKSRAFRILSAAKTRTLHSRPPLYRFQETFHAIKTGRYPNRNAKLLLQLSASLGYSQSVECRCLPPQSPQP